MVTLDLGQGSDVGHSMNLELPVLYAGYFGGIAAQEFLKQGRVSCQNR
jgi:hypothetical protein